MTGNVPFKLFSNCQLVKGVNRSTICDLQRNRVHLVPLILYEILTDFDGRTINEVKAHFENEHDETIQEYFDFLEAEEIIFFSQFAKYFPQLNMQWHAPTLIQNCIIDIDHDSDFDFVPIISSLNSLGCQYLEIRSYFPFEPDKYELLIQLCEETTLSSISLIVPFHLQVTEESWSTLCDKYARITGITIHSADLQKSIHSPKFIVPIDFIEDKISSEKCCGIISENKFLASIEVFTESQIRNTCLNGKISIDAKGNIKNCPSMKLSLGNVKYNLLEDIANQQEFQKAWSISKDRIAVCNECEFRHVCTDCRAYLENPDDQFSKPLKCGYNPYTCQWEEWSSHPMKQNAISSYGLKDLTPLIK